MGDVETEHTGLTHSRWGTKRENRVGGDPDASEWVELFRISPGAEAFLYPGNTLEFQAPPASHRKMRFGGYIYIGECFY